MNTNQSGPDVPRKEKPGPVSSITKTHQVYHNAHNALAWEKLGEELAATVEPGPLDRIPSILDELGALPMGYIEAPWGAFMGPVPLGTGDLLGHFRKHLGSDEPFHLTVNMDAGEDYCRWTEALMLAVAHFELQEHGFCRVERNGIWVCGRGNKGGWLDCIRYDWYRSFAAGLLCPRALFVDMAERDGATPESLAESFLLPLEVVEWRLADLNAEDNGGAA